MKLPLERFGEKNFQKLKTRGTKKFFLVWIKLVEKKIFSLLHASIGRKILISRYSLLNKSNMKQAPSPNFYPHPNILIEVKPQLGCFKDLQELTRPDDFLSLIDTP